MNHLLQDAKTGAPSEYNDIEETMSPAALKLIADWLSRNVLVHPNEAGSRPIAWLHRIGQVVQHGDGSQKASTC